MKKLQHLYPHLFILCVIIIIAGCSKKKSSPQFSAGVGTYTFNGTNMYSTNDTLTGDLFSGGKDVTMWPTSSTNASNIVFVDNIPSQSSGSVNLSDGSNQSSSAPYILGNSNSGSIHFASVPNSGSITKTGPNSFSFSCTVSDDSNPSNTYTLSGSGSY